MTSEMVKAAREYDRRCAQLRKAEEHVQAIRRELDAAREKLAALATESRATPAASITHVMYPTP